MKMSNFRSNVTDILARKEPLPPSSRVKEHEPAVCEEVDGSQEGALKIGPAFHDAMSVEPVVIDGRCVLQVVDSVVPTARYKDRVTTTLDAHYGG